MIFHVSSSFLKLFTLVVSQLHLYVQVSKTQNKQKNSTTMNLSVSCFFSISLKKLRKFFSNIYLFGAGISDCELMASYSLGRLKSPPPYPSHRSSVLLFCLFSFVCLFCCRLFLKVLKNLPYTPSCSPSNSWPFFH